MLLPISAVHWDRIVPIQTLCTVPHDYVYIERIVHNVLKTPKPNTFNTPNHSSVTFQTTTMASVRPMTAMDLFNFNTCNLDHLTETYNTTFYLEYLSKWPHLCRVIEGHNGQIEGYSMPDLRTPPHSQLTPTHSLRQNGSLPIPSPKRTFSPKNKPGSKLSSMARPRNGPHHLSLRPETRLCDSPHSSIRTTM